MTDKCIDILKLFRRSFSSCSEEKSPMVRFPDPNNTKTIGRMIGNCFLGESFQAAPTLPTLSDSIMGNL